jgi:maleylpyruvate isomerase
MTDLTLHGYWRSSAAYRVRIALNLKGMRYRQVSHDLRTGEQRAPDYLAIAPHGLVPALEHENGVLIESPAVLEWIEARWPSPRLLPEDIDQAALVRAMAALVGCDIHPINNLRVLNRLRMVFSADEGQIKDWIAEWIHLGFTPLEQLIAQHGGDFAYGDKPSLADCYIVPQVYNAERFGVDLLAYPRLKAVAETATLHPAFAQAHPNEQPDAQK